MESTTTAAFLVCALAIAYYFTRAPVPRVQRPLKEAYDYIIVGGGSAGSVLASRLSEDSHHTVLLVEAGPEEDSHPLVSVPNAFFELQRSDIDWQYYTVPQKYSCFGLNEKRSYWSRGRLLGGCSSHNAMIYIRGSRHDYDGWAADGCTGWNYKDVLPYFLKNEDMTLNELKSSALHSTGGSWQVENNVVTSMADIYLKAGQEMGYKVVDCNGKDRIGFCNTPSNTKNGQRVSTATAYLRPVMDRSNLDVTTNTLATKVIIENKKATGIEMIKDNRKYTVKANKEVILSGGAINSPQLLMLSGIGPKDHLKELGIPLVAALPVGENLQDHLMLWNEHAINTSASASVAEAESLKTDLKYKLFGKGLLSSNWAEGLAFFDTNNKGYADIQFHIFSAIPAANPVKVNINYNRETIDKINKFHGDAEYGFAVFVGLLRPKSRGTITLKSRDPYEHPIIDPNYLSNPEDVKTYIKGLRIYEKFMETNTIKKLGASKENNGLLPFCKEYERFSDKYWECMVRHFAVTIYHPTTTCRMGPENDPTAVVDLNLKVKGIEGLRVVDASVMRNVPAGNTNVPTIMIAEKASDIIRQKDTVAKFREKIKDVV